MIPERDRVALRPEQATIPPGHSWNRIPAIGAACALLGGGASAILGAANPKQFFFSWLVSFLFFMSLALGALFFVLIQYATQGGWGIVVRRIGETVFATVPVMAALFVPLLFGLQWWVHASAYPLVISGKPYFSWPAFIPITFELGVLFAAFGAVLGMLALNRLPMHHHPLFQSKVFERVTDDAFFISIESWDPQFDPSATGKLLKSLGARSVELLES